MTSEENEKEAQRIREKIKGLSSHTKKTIPKKNSTIDFMLKYGGYANFDGNFTHCKGWKKRR